MKIEVEQKDIDAGVQCNAHRNPVALAIMRAGNYNPGVVAVRFESVDIGTQTHWLPDEVSVWLDIFETAGPGHCAPFSFDLPI